MPYPNNSNYQTGGLGDAWHQFSPNPGTPVLCATQGRSLIGRLQRRLLTRLPELGLSVDSAMPTNGTLDRPTAASLLQAIQALEGVYTTQAVSVAASPATDALPNPAMSAQKLRDLASTLAVLRTEAAAELAASTVASYTAKLANWFAYYEGATDAAGNPPDPAAIQFLGTVTFPTLGVAPANDGRNLDDYSAATGTGQNCWNPLTQIGPQGQPAETTNPNLTPNPNRAIVPSTEPTSPWVYLLGFGLAAGVGVGLSMAADHYSKKRGKKSKKGHAHA